jgi:hypothetical protein
MFSFSFEVWLISFPRVHVQKCVRRSGRPLFLMSNDSWNDRPQKSWRVWKYWSFSTIFKPYCENLSRMKKLFDKLQTWVGDGENNTVAGERVTLKFLSFGAVSRNRTRDQGQAVLLPLFFPLFLHETIRAFVLYLIPDARCGTQNQRLHTGDLALLFLLFFWWTDGSLYQALVFPKSMPK